MPGLTITPAPGSTGRYTLTSDTTVGVVRIGDLTIELRPKVGIAPVLFLVSYALDPRAWKPERAELARDLNLAEAVAVVPLFARTAQQATRPGLLQGYRHRDDTLTAVRGRIRIADQFRAHAGLPLPIEVAYDDFTPDILENQLLRRGDSMRWPDSRRASGSAEMSMSSARILMHRPAYSPTVGPTLSAIAAHIFPLF